MLHSKIRKYHSFVSPHISRDIEFAAAYNKRIAARALQIIKNIYNRKKNLLDLQISDLDIQNDLGE